MKILYLCHDVGLYGAPRSLLNLIDGLRDLGVVPYIVIPRDGDLAFELKRRRIKYKILKMGFTFRNIGENDFSKELFSELKNIRVIAELIVIIKKWNIDLIHTNNLCIDVGAIAALICRKPHIWHIRELMGKDLGIELINIKKIKYLMNKADAIITISNFIYEKYRKIYQNQNMQVIYDYIVYDDYSLSNNNFYIDGTLELLIVGAITEGKGQFEAVKAIKDLKEQGVTNVHLTIVGDGSKKNLYKINKYIKGNNLEELIDIRPFSKNLKEIRKRSAIALVCSKSEGLGRVTIESMLSELLVIGANSGATNELIEHGVTGYIYKSGDAEDLAKQIKYAMDHKDEVMLIKKEAKAYAMNTFTSNKPIEDVFRIYKNALAGTQK
jgi:glycosyltransferase involved in cell wall biosynthesis